MNITLYESLYLSDSLSMFAQAPPLPIEINPFLPVDLLLKVGGAILESEKTKIPANIEFGIDELMMIREVCKSSVVVGGERVGINLLMKIYEELCAKIAANIVDGVDEDNQYDNSNREPYKSRTDNDTATTA